VAQARYKTGAETLDQWVMALQGDERGSTASTRLQVCAGWIEEADANGQADTRGMIGAEKNYARHLDCSNGHLFHKQPATKSRPQNYFLSVPGVTVFRFSIRAPVPPFGGTGDFVTVTVSLGIG
jgi:hypothetical protein